MPLARAGVWGAQLAPPPTPGLLAAELARDAEAVAASLAADPTLRSAAAASLARIGGPLADGWFVAQLGDGREPFSPANLVGAGWLQPPVGDPQEDPAFAGLEDALWTRLALADDEADRAALWFAVARTGGPRSQDRLGVKLQTRPDPRGFEALGMLCSRGFASGAAGLDAIETALASGDGDRAIAAAYALSRCAGPAAELLAGHRRARLRTALCEGRAGAPTEATRWRALAALGELPVTIPAAVLGHDPPPWPVEVEAVRALSTHADGRSVLSDRMAAISLEAVTGPRLHAVLEALRGLRRDAGAGIDRLAWVPARVAEFEVARATASLRRAKELSLVACELRVLAALTSGQLAPVRACSIAVPELPSDYGEVLAIEALLMMGTAVPRDARVEALVRAAADSRPRVAQAALSGLADVDAPQVGAALRDALQRVDVGIQAAAAGAIAARSVDARLRDELATVPLRAAVQAWSEPAAIEARLAAIEALANLARTALAPLRPPETRSADAPTPVPKAEETLPPWLTETLVPLGSDPHVAVRDAVAAALRGTDALARVQAAAPVRVPDAFAEARRAVLSIDLGLVRGIRLVTSAGPITIAFTSEVAPIARATLVSLAQTGFFTDTTFHRVVPGFVIQGGDPRGDGYGGPGFVMPCERSALEYRRGTVGIALAGKDTGGSQFFVTYGRQPHLDGRYTVVGQVEPTDLDTIDAILAFDRIERVEVVR